MQKIRKRQQQRQIFYSACSSPLFPTYDLSYFYFLLLPFLYSFSIKLESPIIPKVIIAVTTIKNIPMPNFSHISSPPYILNHGVSITYFIEKTSLRNILYSSNGNNYL